MSEQSEHTTAADQQRSDATTDSDVVVDDTLADEMLYGIDAPNGDDSDAASSGGLSDAGDAATPVDESGATATGTTGSTNTGTSAESGSQDSLPPLHASGSADASLGAKTER